MGRGRGSLNDVDCRVCGIVASSLSFLLLLQATQSSSSVLVLFYYTTELSQPRRDLQRLDRLKSLMDGWTDGESKEKKGDERERETENDKLWR